MLWQTEVGVVSDSPEIQPQSQPPAQGHVPMEEREARANRFVSLVVGHTGNVEQQKRSNGLHHSLLAVQRRVVEARQQEAEELLYLPSTYSDQQADQTNQQHKA